jgi:hypothetical protein
MERGQITFRAVERTISQWRQGNPRGEQILRYAAVTNRDWRSGLQLYKVAPCAGKFRSTGTLNQAKPPINLRWFERFDVSVWPAHGKLFDADGLSQAKMDPFAGLR